MGQFEDYVPAHSVALGPAAVDSSPVDNQSKSCPWKKPRARAHNNLCKACATSNQHVQVWKLHLLQT